MGIAGLCVSALLAFSIAVSIKVATTKKSPSLVPTNSPSASPLPSPAINSIGAVIDITKVYVIVPASSKVSVNIDTVNNTLTFINIVNNVYNTLVLPFSDPKDGTSLTILPPGSPSPGSTGATGSPSASGYSGYNVNVVLGLLNMPIILADIVTLLTKGTVGSTQPFTCTYSHDPNNGDSIVINGITFN